MFSKRSLQLSVQTSVYHFHERRFSLFGRLYKVSEKNLDENLDLFSCGNKFVYVNDHNVLITANGAVLILYVGCLLYFSCNNFVYKILTVVQVGRWLLVVFISFLFFFSLVFLDGLLADALSRHI